MKAIIFDLQGTLLENGIFPSPIKQARYILGVRREFKDFVPIFEDALLTSTHESLAGGFNAVAEAFDVSIENHTREQLVGMWNKNKLLSRPFPDTLNILSDLKKEYRLILIANIDCFTKDVITKFGFNEYFSNIYLSCDIGMLKTNTDFFSNILKDTGLSSQDVLMVGDSIESDMKTASRLGIRTILIDRNNRQEYPEKITTLSELIGLLE
ncbi:MAG: HAD family hydrolase [Candidatus Woesearchaeota archaeon]